MADVQISNYIELSSNRSPRLIGDFQIDFGSRKLGSGSFADVLLGHESNCPQHKVAIKVLRYGKYSNMAVNEIMALKKISEVRCVNLVQLLHADYIEGRRYIVMELCKGDLLDLLREKQVFLERELTHLAKEMAVGLKHLRSLKIYHRDLKPDNILMSYTEKRVIWDITFKIGDFGSSRILNDNEVILDTLGGTKSYMAPEILERMGGNHRSDLWSLGVILYGCGSKKLPLNIFKDKYGDYIVKKTAINFDWVRNKDLKNLLMCLLMKDPDSRMTVEELNVHPFVRSAEEELLRNKERDKKELEGELEDMRRDILTNKKTDGSNFSSDSINCFMAPIILIAIFFFIFIFTYFIKYYLA